MYTTHKMMAVMRSGAPAERSKVAQLLILNLNEWLPIVSKREFKGLTLKKRGDDWLLVVRGVYGRKAQVVFVDGPDPEGVYINFVYAMLFGLLRWKEDKYAK